MTGMSTRSNKIPLLKRLSLNVFARYKKAQTSLHELNYLFWECTLCCNLCCLHCGSDCRTGSENDDMPLADFLGVLDRAKTICNPHTTMLALTGGEPLLRKDLETCGKEFYRREFPWGIVTNGYAMTPARFEDLIASGLRSMTLSLDGLEASHNWLRGQSGSFAKALNMLEYVPKTPKLVFDVVTCVNQKNFPELQDVRRLLIDHGVRKWRLFNIFPKGRAKDNPLLDVTNEQFRQLMEFIKQTRKAGQIAANYACEGFLGPYEGEVARRLFLLPGGRKRSFRPRRRLHLRLPKPARRLHSGQHPHRRFCRRLAQPLPGHARPVVDPDRDLQRLQRL